MTETAPAKTPFPERMHNQSVEIHGRRARNALEAITKDAAMLLWRLENGHEVDASSARQLAEEAIRACEHLSVLETLREVREWDEAERNDPLVTTHQGRAIDARNNIPATETTGETQ